MPSVATGADNDVLANTINQAPVFPDLDLEMEGRQTAQTSGRSDENMFLYNLGTTS